MASKTTPSSVTSWCATDGGALAPPGVRVERIAVVAGGVRLTWSDGHEGRFEGIWLRDNCLCEGCRHPTTNQRVRDVVSLPERPVPMRIGPSPDGGLRVTWSDPEGSHPSRYPAAWLRAHCPCDACRAARRPRLRLWDASLPVPDVPYLALGDPGGERAFLEHLRDLGFVRLRDVPDERGMVARVAERFGHVRTTNYGRVFDVETVPDADHLAYTGVALALHTDNPYRSPAPGIQLLHCLESDLDGGDTLLADGFRAAYALRDEQPEAFEVLARVPVAFRYRAKTVDLRHHRPLIELDPEGAVAAVYFNDRSMAPLDAARADVVPFYAAYRAFARRLTAPEAVLSFRLEPGDLLVFDNQRVLHGRTALSGKGRRLLQGCYADRDAFESRLRRLVAGLGR